MAVRATGLKNFKGDAYITKPELDDAIEAATGGESGLIDKDTGNLRHDLNPIHITSIDNPTPSNATQEGADTKDQDFSNIQFIGNCKVFYRNGGKIVIRIGDNLNSSTFNTTDGQTNGTASMTRANDGSSVRVNGAASPTANVIRKGVGTNNATITTAEKIHFDDNASTVLKLTVKSKSGATTNEYSFGPITGNGYYVAGAGVSQSAPSDAVYLRITGFQEEAKTAEGATGYEGKPTFTVKLDSLELADGTVQVRVDSVSGTEGAANYPVAAGAFQTVCYYINDTTTKPTAKDAKLVLPEVNTTNTVTYAGITSFKAGTYTYSVTVGDMANPATDAHNGASIQFDNTKNFCGDIKRTQVTTYTGAISMTGSSWTTGAYTGIGDNSVSGNVWNINGATAFTGGIYKSDGTTKVTAIDVYTGTPDSTVTAANRRSLDGNAFSDAANCGENDLMLYHGAIQYPVSNITTAFVGNEHYAQPTVSGDKKALFWFSAQGTEKGGTITINGTNLTNSNVKSVKLGNSKDNVLDVTSTAGIGTAPNKSAKQLIFPYTFKTEADYITSDTGCWVEIVFSGVGPTITSIARG